MRQRKPKRRGLSPAAAVVLLLVSVGVAIFSLRSQFGGASGDRGDHDPASAAVDVEPESGESNGGEAVPGRDLLADHGSWQNGTPVRMAFASRMVTTEHAAPAAETRLADTTRWVGADPPALRVGVVMVGEAAQRAVVDGVVVGVGDHHGSAVIVGIELDAVHVTWAGRRLTYDLENEHPREFRAELARRKEPVGDMPAPSAAKKKQGEDQ